MQPKFAVALTIIGLTAMAPLCGAQQQQGTRSNYQPKNKNPQVLRQNAAQAVYQRVNAPPELPALPAFTSGQFMYARTGTVGRNQSKAVHVEYAINDAPQTVINWYDTVLKQNGWKVNLKNDTSIYGSRLKDGNSVSIFIDNNHRVGFRYRLNIAYRFFKSVDEEHPGARNTSSNQYSQQPTAPR